MDGRIAHLRSHYRMVGAQAAASAMAMRLDHVREAAIRNYDEMLSSALTDDESVYVLRRVKARMSLTLSAESTDEVLARSWGSLLAAAVMRAIAKGEHESGNVVRFENQAAYVASFLVALLKGTDPDQWFYESFKRFATLETKIAIRSVLIDNVVHLPAILAHVHRSGVLDSLIAALDSETKQALWSPEIEQRDDLEVTRSLFTGAVQLLDKLGMSGRVPRNSENLFRNYWDTTAPFADWRDPRSLAESVCEVVRFFFARGYINQPEGTNAELLVRIDEALEEFEWLDREWLKTSVFNLLAQENWTTPDLPLRVSSDRATLQQREPPAQESWTTSDLPLRVSSDSATPQQSEPPAQESWTTSDLPLRVSSGCATPRQRELLAAIAKALGDATVLRDDPLSAALKVLALLVDAAPGWAGDTAAKVMIENLLTTRSAIREAASRSEFIKRLQCRDVDEALRLLPLETRERAREACRTVASLGEPALALLEKLSDQEDDTALSDGIESDCAGVSLMLRPLLDARLHQLTGAIEYPAASECPRSVMLFLLIAVRISGESVFVNGQLDDGLRLLCGMEETPKLDALRAYWSRSETSDHTGFQKALLNVVAGQRLLEPATMHVFQIDCAGNRKALIAADESEALWPLARVIDSDADVVSVVSEWEAIWKDATGVAPRVVINGSKSARERFLETAEALEQGQTGNPNLDLTTSIVTCMLLRLWARWLRGFSGSSVSFLLENFIRRPGRFCAKKDLLVIELERRPMDLVMEMAGYLSDLENIPWLPGTHIKFSLKGD